MWILKPSGLSRGRGIFLLNSAGDAVCGQQSVVQRYVADPLLLRGHKFDLRLYVLVTSFNPLEAFVHREGFARVAVRPYSTAAADLAEELVHLTNATIQGSDALAALPPPIAAGPDDPDGRTKISLSRLWPLLEAETTGAGREALWPAICCTVLAALYSAQDAIPHQVRDDAHRRLSNAHGPRSVANKSLFSMTWFVAWRALYVRATCREQGAPVCVASVPLWRATQWWVDLASVWKSSRTGRGPACRPTGSSSWAQT